MSEVDPYLDLPISKIFELTNTGIIQLDKEWRYTYVNQSAEKILGVACNKLLGKTIWEIFPQDKLSPFFETCFYAMKEKQTITLKDHCSNPGTWVDIIIHPTSEGLKLIFNDVTSIKNEKLKLQTTFDRLEVATAAARLGVWEWDIVENKFYWDDQCQRLIGLITGTFKGTLKHYRSLVHPEDWPRIKISSKKAIDSRRMGDIEYRCIHPDQSIHWLKSHARTIYDPETLAPIRLTGVIENIDATKQLESDLRFVANASRTLTSSLNYKETLSKVASFAVPDFADIAIFELFDEGGGVERISAFHKDPAYAWQMEQLLLNPPTKGHPLHKLKKVPKAFLQQVVTESFLNKIAHNKEHLKVLRSLSPNSCMFVPLIVMGQTFGALTFITCDRRSYIPSDLVLAEDVANRASQAITHALHFELKTETLSKHDDSGETEPFHYTAPSEGLRLH
ncbi:MAG: PAS domain-containing protein [Bdellovibrionales bacterium]|nr:PAS domain-containing protein [Bdellovibrionales bacterium]